MKIHWAFTGSTIVLAEKNKLSQRWSIQIEEAFFLLEMCDVRFASDKDQKRYFFLQTKGCFPEKIDRCIRVRL
jgi:hypothetical protein